MKITNVEPIIVSAGPGKKNFCFVVVDTDEGISGVGESGLSCRELAVAGAVEHLKSFLVGKNPFQIERLWQEMFRGGFFPANNITTSAIAAIDIALWDIKGKALNVPIYELLGGLARDRVLCYGHIRGATPEALVEAARPRVEEGWKVLRWSMSVFPDKVFEPREAVPKVLAHFEALRNEFGDTLELIHDMHQRLDAPEAIELCRAAEQYRPFFMEDPVRAEGIHTLRLVRQHVNVPIAVGEQLSHKWEFREIIPEQLTDYARVDVCIAGGITETRKIAAMAEAYDVALALHCPLGPIALAACLQLDAVCSNAVIQEQSLGIHYNQANDLLAYVANPSVFAYADGHVAIPAGPGLGIEIDEDAVVRGAAQGHRWRPPVWRHEDGSFAEW